MQYLVIEVDWIHPFRNMHKCVIHIRLNKCFIDIHVFFLNYILNLFSEQHDLI